MAFNVSPSVNTQEIDLSNFIESIPTTEAAIAGVFSWGPVEFANIVTSERDLVSQYGKPTNFNFETFFCAASFLSYSNQLYVSRASANAFNSVAGPTWFANSGISNTIIKNQLDYNLQANTLSSGNTYYIAKWPSSLGNSLKISVCDNANAFSSVLNLSNFSNNSPAFSFVTGTNTVVLTVSNINLDTVAATANANFLLNQLTVGDFISTGNTFIGTQSMKIAAVGNVSIVNTSTVTANIGLTSIFALSANYSANTLSRYWEYYNAVTRAPNTSPYTAKMNGIGDELHVVIVDQDGLFTGSNNEVLEVFPGLSRATDAQGVQGGSIYYKNVIDASSKYVWWAYDRAGAPSNTAANITPSGNQTPLSLAFEGGSDGFAESNIPLTNLTNAYNVYASPEQIDVSLIIGGKSVGGLGSTGLPAYIIYNILENRKDAVGFFSPNRESVVNTYSDPTLNVAAFRNLLPSTSYGVLDSGYKLMYDQYNDVNRYVPLNGDIAGLCARTDYVRDAWWSPAGFNRGQIKNVISLAYNPDQPRRNIIYPIDINPVVTFPAQGTILFGDRTMLNEASAFNRINVRRLFIVLEKSIATAAKFMLFEFNDAFTRSQFVNMVEPYLRDIMGRRGIYDFNVVCDQTNNTPEIIDNNQFVGDIYIKPAKSINEILLRFVAVRTGVSFNEVVNNF